MTKISSFAWPRTRLIWRNNKGGGRNQMKTQQKYKKNGTVAILTVGYDFNCEGGYKTGMAELRSGTARDTLICEQV